MNFRHTIPIISGIEDICSDLLLFYDMFNSCAVFV